MTKWTADRLIFSCYEAATNVLPYEAGEIDTSGFDPMQPITVLTEQETGLLSMLTSGIELTPHRRSFWRGITEDEEYFEEDVRNKMRRHAQEEDWEALATACYRRLDALAQGLADEHDQKSHHRLNLRSDRPGLTNYFNAIKDDTEDCWDDTITNVSRVLRIGTRVMEPNWNGERNPVMHGVKKRIDKDWAERAFASFIRLSSVHC